MGGAKAHESSLCVALEWLLQVLGEASAELLLGPGVTDGPPAVVRSLTKGGQAALGLGGLETGNSVETNLDMETVSTIH